MKLIKSIFVLIMAILLIVCAVGCSRRESSDIPLNSNTSQNTLPLSSEPAETTPRKVLPEPEGCTMSYFFYSLRDMNTYLQTGSTNRDDYLEPDGLFWLSNCNVRMETLRKTYLPLEELFSLDENQIDLCEGIAFGHMDGGGLYYGFDIGSSDVEITYAPSHYSESISKNPLDYIELSTEDQVINDFSSRSQYDECYISRNVKNSTMIYNIRKGTPLCVSLIMGNYKIKVYPARITNATSKEEALSTYNTFMTSEATAPFAALFSEDDAVVEQALKRIASAIEAKEASIKASAN